MEYATIEREIQIDASPEVVYQVVSSPEHLRQWWPDEAVLEAVPGAQGEIRFGDLADPEAKTVPVTVVEADPPRRFSMRWVYDDARSPSLLVTFDLTPVGGGTLLRFTEAGFREMGWQAAVLEETYLDHSRGWDHFLPRLDTYAARLVTTT